MNNLKKMALLPLMLICVLLSAQDRGQGVKFVKAEKINPTTVEVLLSDSIRMTFDFYGNNIFRMFRDNSGGIIRDPEAKPEAQILVNNPRKELSALNVKQDDKIIEISTPAIQVYLDKNSSLMKVVNLKSGAVVMEEIAPLSFGKNKVTMSLKEHPAEYFYGGGVQNGRFSHKGKAVAIENQNSWTDGGVASPTPYYWSTNGYGVMWYTFKKGIYDFGFRDKGVVKLSHETPYLDMFVMVNEGAVPLLNDFYQLTGNPVLMPKFGFYEGHLNAYNRDFWKEDEKGILFEDGKRYKESQKDNGGIKESLNGEKGNYQFSARGVIDRYKSHDMPFGWLLSNDGYGAGYGQTETIDGNIQNLKSLTDYAHKNGIEIGLWTQSDLHPKAGVSALLQRDIVKEVRDAGVRVLKTDVAWVGAGYSFGLKGIADVAQIMTYYGNDSRPFIISLDGWAGTQRYAGVWSGDQTGGLWEYIRFHIPTYIGSGLSGQPNICSDMDGIFGGKNVAVNTRDFQWKTFTPMQLNMDGWGSSEKYPHALGEPITSINRTYLKMKSELMPYAYSIAEEAIDGKPMIRAMFLEYPNRYTLGRSTQYQFLYGPYFLVAPIYQATKSDDKGNDIRNGIYLPGGEWIDYITGDKFTGGRVINNFDAPIWKLPVFVRAGAIIPVVNPNNNVSEIDSTRRMYEVYPAGYSSFTEYDDDGKTQEYIQGKGTTTLIESNVLPNGRAVITVNPTVGDFSGAVKNKKTEFCVNVTAKPKRVSATAGGSKLKLTEAKTLDEFNCSENVYFYNEAPNLNRFATKGSDFEKVVITKNPQLLVKLGKINIMKGNRPSDGKTELVVDGFVFNPADKFRVSIGALKAPSATINEGDIQAYTLKPSWNKVENADYYEIEFDSMLYSTIKDTELLFDALQAETEYNFKVRAVNKDGYSDWNAFTTKTKNSPLEFAIKTTSGVTTAKSEEGMEIEKLFDFDETSMWHTQWDEKSIPMTVTIDLNSVNTVEKFHYVPRPDRTNGILTKGSVSYSMNKKDWVAVGDFEWAKNNDVKVFEFKDKPVARYIKIEFTEGVNNYGSGREIYVFKVPGTESYIPGDINNDGKIDENDLTSYINYTGLRYGDGDFEGYISVGDINKNALIDAYDISNVTTKLEGGIETLSKDTLSGKLDVVVPKRHYSKDEIVEIVVKGVDMKAVNALSLALPYNAQDFEFVGIETKGTKAMLNITNDRLHTNGDKVLYPTFVNIGDKELLSDTADLFIIKMKVKRPLTPSLTPTNLLLVGQTL